MLCVLNELGTMVQIGYIPQESWSLYMVIYIPLIGLVITYKDLLLMMKFHYFDKLSYYSN